MWKLFQRNSSQTLPAWWSEYSAANQAKKADEVGLLRFVCFDTETTGLDVKKDQLLSIGAIAVSGQAIAVQDSFECLIALQGTSPAFTHEAVAVHGILPGAGAAGWPEAEAVAQFVAYVGNAVLVGQHVAFDVGMINKHLKQHYGVKLLNNTLDTAHLAMRLDGHRFGNPPNSGEYSLDALCTRFQIPTHDRHTAAGDAYLTAVLLLKLLSRLEQRGVKSTKGLLR